MAELTYPEVGATRHGPLPGGYHHLRHRYPAAGRLLPGRGRGGAELAAAPRRRRPDARPTGRGRPRACGSPPAWASARSGSGGPAGWSGARIDRGSAGFGYGTLPGHPERRRGGVRGQPRRRRRGLVRGDARSAGRPAGSPVPAARPSGPSSTRTPGGSAVPCAGSAPAEPPTRAGQNRANERIGARGPYFGAWMPAAASSRQTRPRWPRNGSSRASIRASSPRASPASAQATVFGMW